MSFWLSCFDEYCLKYSVLSLKKYILLNLHSSIIIIFFNSEVLFHQMFSVSCLKLYLSTQKLSLLVLHAIVSTNVQQKIWSHCQLFPLAHIFEIIYSLRSKIIHLLLFSKENCVFLKFVFSRFSLLLLLKEQKKIELLKQQQ